MGPINGTLTCITTSDQSGTGTNSNEEVLQTSQRSRTGALPPARCDESERFLLFCQFISIN